MDNGGKGRIKEKEKDTRTIQVRREYSYRSPTMAPKSLLGIFTITNKSASAQILLYLSPRSIPGLVSNAERVYIF
jgi:hypothetical protein